MLTRTQSAVLVAVVGVFALTLVATGLPVTDSADAGSAGTGGGGPATPSEGPRAGGTAPAIAASPAVAVGLLLALLVLAAVLLRHGGRVAAATLGGVALLALLAGGAWLFSGGAPATTAPPADAATTPQPGGSAADGGTTFTSPLSLLGLFLGGAGLAGAGVLALRWRGEAGDPAVEGSDGDGADAEAIGRAAGRAADRIRSETPSADNAVYRCWVEVTELADTEAPESYTPAEFAAAAVEAGMDPDHVGELRRLFEAVRYGPADAATHEERALSVFERIEAAYAAGDGGGNGNGDGGESE